MYKQKFNQYGMSIQYDNTTARAQFYVFEVFIQGIYIPFGKSTKKKNDHRSRKYDIWKKICQRNLECLDWRGGGWRGVITLFKYVKGNK